MDKAWTEVYNLEIYHRKDLDRLWELTKKEKDKQKKKALEEESKRLHEEFWKQVHAIYDKYELPFRYDDYHHVWVDRNVGEENYFGGDERIPKDRSKIAPFFVERECSKESVRALIDVGYERIKISWDGRGGALYYLVRPRYNEGTEHAFFCVVLEQLLVYEHAGPTVSVSSGPDVWAENMIGENICFEVETGTMAETKELDLITKFKKDKRTHNRLFILVTNRDLIQEYKKYGNVITRAQIDEVIDAHFHKHNPPNIQYNSELTIR